MTTAAEAPTRRAANHALSWLRQRGRAVLAGIRPHLAIYAIAFTTYDCIRRENFFYDISFSDF